MTSPAPLPQETEPVRGVPYGLARILLRWRRYAWIWRKVAEQDRLGERSGCDGAVVVTLPFKADGRPDAPRSELVLR